MIFYVTETVSVKERRSPRALTLTELLKPVAAGPCSSPLVSGSLASAFRDTCASFPDRPALTVPDTSTLTYAELLRAAEQVAVALAAHALPAHSLIGICLDRSAALVVATAGVLLAGHAYLPLDPAYPEARLRIILADANPPALITGQAFADAVADLPTHRLVLEGTALKSCPTASAVPPPPEDPDALAYVIYTSGSTGQPKGVMVSHRNVLRLFQQTDPWFHFSPQDVWTMFHSFSFDFSVWEMWGPLLTGGRLVLVPFALSRDPEAFRTLLSRERVTVLNQTPTAFRLLDEADRGASTPLSLRLIIFGGEALILRSLLPWIERHGDSDPRLINMYGITETTVHVTYRPILRADAEHETESLIGVPIPDLNLHLLDEHLQALPDGVSGEIFIGGPGVALGYLAQPALTAARFMETQFAGRLYRTGDLARRRPDGELLFLGRADRQVKINGFRIELGEVEATLLHCPAVGQLAVAEHPDRTAGPRLVVCFTLCDHHAASELSRFAAAQLPAHMRPSLYVPVSRLPLTLNGKLDLSALPARTLLTQPLSGNGLEHTVAEAWQHVLGRTGISPTENFFDAGGTSLQLIALRTRLQLELARTLPITWFFQHTTVEALTRKLSEPETGPFPAHPALPASQRNSWLAVQAQRKQAQRRPVR